MISKLKNVTICLGQNVPLKLPSKSVMLQIVLTQWIADMNVVIESVNIFDNILWI